MAKKIIKKKVVQEKDPFLLTGNKALLLAEGCKIDKQKKDIEKRLKEIKDELELDLAGEYSNSAGDRLNLSFTPRFTDPDPKEVYAIMKTKKLGKFFWKCIKVGLTEAKKYVSEKELNKLRKELDPIKRHSFK
jgi:tetrahydromethanopterin S-methyltransferase subunit G